MAFRDWRVGADNFPVPEIGIQTLTSLDLRRRGYLFRSKLCTGVHLCISSNYTRYFRFQFVPSRCLAFCILNG
jgi:hypothetical protein